MKIYEQIEELDFEFQDYFPDHELSDWIKLKILFYFEELGHSIVSNLMRYACELHEDPDRALDYFRGCCQGKIGHK